MADKYISAGVFTTEEDQSFVPEAPTSVGAVVVGRAQKGPAFVPVTVANWDSFVQTFGGEDPNNQLPYAAKNWLKNSSALTVVRVLGHADGTNVAAGYTVGGIIGIADCTGSGAQLTGSILATIHHSGAWYQMRVTGSSATELTFRILNDDMTTTVFGPATVSFITSSDNYIGKVLNTDPTKYSTYKHYLAEVYTYVTASAFAEWKALSLVTNAGAPTNAFSNAFSGGSTPWIKSHLLGGLEHDLFKFHTLAHGRAANDQIKVTIANIKPSATPSATPYGTFDVIVRDFYDSDTRQTVLESFTGLTLDPGSKNYVARRIGDVYEEFDTATRKFVAYGTYPSKSKHIRVELNASSVAPAEALPWGFRGFSKAMYSGSIEADTNNVGYMYPKNLPYTVFQKDSAGNYNQNVCWGVSFVSGGVVDRMRALPSDIGAKTGSDNDFSLKGLTAYSESGQTRYYYNQATTTWTPLYVSASLQRFTVPFAGGFDGFDLRVEDPLYLGNATTETDIGVVALKRGVDCVANPDIVDFHVAAVPGVHNLRVTDYVRTLANERRDFFYVMDVTGSTVSETVNGVKGRDVDDNYVGCYYPDLKLNDRVNNKVVRVAPSVAVLGAIAYSDRVGQVFFAPAGLTRGGLGQFDIVDVVDRLTFTDRNDLYDARINPIATFPNEGITIWGQKTLQVKSSSLDRINVRRLLIYAKRVVSTLAKQLVFEPNDANTWQKFVNPILERVRQQQGIERFKVVMDSSTTTSDDIERYRMNGKIFLQPTRAAEYVEIAFVVTNAGVKFEG